MKKPDQKPKSLCMAPWTHTYLSPQSERRLCCASREPAQNFKQYIDTESNTGEYNPLSLDKWWNSEHVREVRRKMMHGETPSECEVCNNKLLNTDVYRDYFWHMFGDKYNDIWEQTDDLGYTTMKPVSWDWRFSNLCNFKCRMCGDMLSSSWEAEEKVNNMVDWNDPNNAWMKEPLRTKISEWQKSATEQEFKAAIEAKTVEEIYWVGGEPLMYEQHWEYMQRIIDLGYADRVYVRYNTNLSRAIYKGVELWDDVLSHFRDWQICASLDGTNEVGEYIRTGLNYGTWYENFNEGKRWAKDNPNRMKIDFTLTMPGLLEINHMNQLAKHLQSNLLTKVTFAFTPDVLMSPLALPRVLLDEIIDETLARIEMNSMNRSLIDVLQNLKQRPTFAEQWPDEYKDAAKSGKKRLLHLDKIRKGKTMEDILSADSRLLDWWNKIDE